MSGIERRDFLMAGGALVIGFHLRPLLSGQERGSVAGPPDAKQVDTWLAIHADNTATVYIGFAELGQEIPPREELTPQALAAYHKSEIEKWWPLIKAAGLKAE